MDSRISVTISVTDTLSPELQRERIPKSRASYDIGLRLWSWFVRKERPIQLRLQLGDEIVGAEEPTGARRPAQAIQVSRKSEAQQKRLLS